MSCGECLCVLNVECTVADVSNPPLCTLVGHADDWHRDDPAEPGYNAEITALAIETCGHCSLQRPCAEQAEHEWAGVWGGISASALRATRPAVLEADWVVLQREQDAALAHASEELTADAYDPYAMLRAGRQCWEPSDPSDVLLSVEQHGVRATARDQGIDRNTLRGWLSRQAA